MPRSISAPLEAHLGQEVTTLATCIRIVRTDGQEFFLTDSDRDILFGGDTYLASAPYDRSAVESTAAMTADNFEVTGLLDNAVLLSNELAAGLFDHAEVYLFLVNWADPSQGALRQKRGRLGEVSLLRGDVFSAEIDGMAKDLQQVVGELYSPECRASLGDARCKVPVIVALVQRNTAYAAGDLVRVSPASQTYAELMYRCTVAGTTDAVEPTYPTVVGNTVVDGTATFEAEQSWSMTADIGVVTDRRTFTLPGILDARAVDDWFKFGAVKFLDGVNSGKVVQVKGWTASSKTVELMFPAPFDIDSTSVFIYPGCDRRRTTCINKFDNILNYRGEPFVPGTDFMTRFPDAT